MRLVANQMSFSYNTDKRDRPMVLSNLSFTAEPGSYWCLAGPNGSGKSTFLKLACGLLPIDNLTGELSWNGKPVSEWDRLGLAREIAFVSANLKTMFGVPTSEFVLQGRYAKSDYWARPKVSDREIVDQALEQVGISALAQVQITRLSAGELQLAMIARALAQEPKVLVLDEATANLDLHFQYRILKLIEKLNRSGLTILLVSHDLNLAAEFCPNVLWLKQGSVHAQGTMDQTLTSTLLNELYGIGAQVEIAKNPFTSRPKIFWR